MNPARQPSSARLSWVRAAAVGGLLIGLFFMHGLTSEHGGHLPVSSESAHGAGIELMAPSGTGSVLADAPTIANPMLGGHGLGVMCLAILTIGLLGLLRTLGRRRQSHSRAIPRPTMATIAMAEVARGSPHHLRPTLSSLGISRT